jgi:hypothetical protein
LSALVGEKRTAGEDERTDKRPEGGVDLARRAGSQDMQLQPERTSSVLQASRFGPV